MPATKIVNENELMRWFDQGKTHQEMADAYLEKYNLEVGRTMFANFARRRGLDRRQTRDDKLIPWEVKMEHRYAHSILMLRIEARRRAGFEIGERQEHAVKMFKQGLAEDGAVIHYEPDTEQGWFRVPPRPGIDLDLIREPDRATTKMKHDHSR
jgi:hypothetical protein